MLKTFDSGDYEIDEAEDFSFDGSSLKKVPISMPSINYTTFMTLSGDLYGIDLSFKSSLNIEANKGCFAKFTVPISVDFSGKDFQTIQSSGMLVDGDGNE